MPGRSLPRQKGRSLIRAALNDSVYHVKRGLMMTAGFKVGSGLKQGDGLAPNLFNIAMEYV